MQTAMEAESAAFLQRHNNEGTLPSSVCRHSAVHIGARRPTLFAIVRVLPPPMQYAVCSLAIFAWLQELYFWSPAFCAWCILCLSTPIL